jgi:hypothetical protein
MKCHHLAYLSLLVFLLTMTGWASGSDSSFVLPVSLSAGMGANYVNPRDVVEMINGTYAPTSRVAQFTAVADFFGAVNVPVSPDWVVKLEYAYSLTTLNVSSSMFGASEFTLSMHMPSIYLQYVLLATPMYHLKAGAGGGVYFGKLEVRYWGIDASYSAKGPGMALEMEGQTAFAEDLFLYFGANVRWAFVGELKNSAGRAPGVNVHGDAVSLDQFSAGARLGFAYAF